ncbi:hypothetical protein IFM47457_07561 [Aspergillus lentulus]|nr:hypothetical protein IFM47457_07561 [Aspergillus lentulus]
MPRISSHLQVYIARTGLATRSPPPVPPATVTEAMRFFFSVSATVLRPALYSATTGSNLLHRRLEK